MKRTIFAIANTIFLLTLLLLPHTRTGLQEQQIQISLRRNWGFSSGTGKIQGTFSIRASGPDDLNQVIFYLDDQVLGEINQPPYNLQFTTENYPVGFHKIYATGTAGSGAELTSNLIQVEFVSAGEGWQSVMNIIIPVGVVILIAVGLAVGIPLIFSRGKKESLPLGAPRSYGIHGGAICPKCSRPFSRHIYGLNLGTHKYDRCPYCGKWSLVRRASKAELEAAEAAELKTAQEGVFQPQVSEEEKFRRDLEESRFED